MCCRSGVGTALLAAVRARAEAEGCGKVSLEVMNSNDGARRLYERCGFKFAMAFGELAL